MTVPTRTEAASLLLSLGGATWFLRHARAVAEVAAWLARAAAGRTACNRAAVEAAALLHDADKAVPGADPIRRFRHGEGSAAWLRRLGHPELGPLVADHSVTRLLQADADAWIAGAPLEAAIVAYADKRAGQRLEPMAARFAEWARRYDDDAGWTIEQRTLALERANVLEARVCEAAGCEPGDVARLAWTGAALRRAAPAVATPTGVAAR
jgi:hypothetical protein